MIKAIETRYKGYAPPFAGEFLLCQGLPGEKRTPVQGMVSGFEFILWSHRRRPWFVQAENGFEGRFELNALHPHYHREAGSGGRWLLDYWDACKKARSARFEHGETP